MVRLIETGNHQNGCNKWSISNEWRRSVWLDGHGWATNKMILLSNMRICALYAQNAMNQHRYRYMYSNEWIHHLFAHLYSSLSTYPQCIFIVYGNMAYMKLHKLHYSKTLYIFGGHEWTWISMTKSFNNLIPNFRSGWNFGAACSRETCCQRCGNVNVDMVLLYDLQRLWGSYFFQSKTRGHGFLNKNWQLGLFRGWAGIRNPASPFKLRFWWFFCTFQGFSFNAGDMVTAFPTGSTHRFSEEKKHKRSLLGRGEV